MKSKSNYIDHGNITRFYEIFYRGGAKDLYPARFNEIMTDLKNSGVEVNWSETTKPWEGSYQPAGGRVRFNENIDLSTLEHEYRHFLDDKLKGFPGLRYYTENPSVQTQMEVDAYGLEKSILNSNPSIPEPIKVRVREAIDIFLEREKHLINRF